MSFKNSKYFKTYVEKRIAEFMSCSSDFTQADIRSIYSRAYYTILLHCRDELCLNITDKSIHSEIRNHIKSEYARKIIIKFCDYRNKADYINRDFTSNNAELNSIKRNMNYILSLDSKKLQSNN